MTLSDRIMTAWMARNPLPDDPDAAEAWGDREWHLRQMLEFHAYESAVIQFLVPEGRRLVVLCETLDGRWAAKLCQREPHKTLPACGGDTPAEALLAAIERIET